MEGKNKYSNGKETKEEKGEEIGIKIPLFYSRKDDRYKKERKGKENAER